MMDQVYFKRLDLLLSVLPIVMEDPRLALKGGTAINLFVFDMPRLSVDIDLTYIPIEDRTTSLTEINQIFRNIKKSLMEKGYIVDSKFTAENHAKQLIILDQNDLVKIEINHVLRGCVNPPVHKTINLKPRDIFKKHLTVQCLEENDLFAGKICAALDRQHPRDLYDMRYFFENKTYTRELHLTFLVYLISNNRPIAELTYPNQQDISHLYTNEFQGMTEFNISLEELYETFKKIVSLIRESMTADDKEFILSFKAGKPKWNLLPFDHIKDLPAVKWKLYNISKIDPAKHKVMIKNLESKLG